MEALTKINHAAVELFMQFGFKNVTMDDIARRAGISKKTLYQHYTNKADVIAASVSWYQNHKCEGINTLMGTASNAIEALVRVDLELASLYRKMNPIGLLELQRFYPDAYENFRAVMLTQDVEMMRQTVARGIKEGLFRPEIDPDFTARYRIETALLALQPNLMVNDRYSLMQVGSAITEMFIYGICTPKGEKVYTRYKEKYSQKTPKA